MRSVFYSSLLVSRQGTGFALEWPAIDHTTLLLSLSSFVSFCFKGIPLINFETIIRPTCNVRTHCTIDRHKAASKRKPSLAIKECTHSSSDSALHTKFQYPTLEIRTFRFQAWISATSAEDSCMLCSSSMSLDRSFMNRFFLSSQSNKPSLLLVTANTTRCIFRTATQSRASSVILSFLQSIRKTRKELLAALSWRHHVSYLYQFQAMTRASTKIQLPCQQHAAIWHMSAIFATQPIHLNI